MYSSKSFAEVGRCVVDRRCTFVYNKKTPLIRYLSALRYSLYVDRICVVYFIYIFTSKGDRATTHSNPQLSQHQTQYPILYNDPLRQNESDVADC